MRYTPSYQLNILTEEEFPTRIKVIEEELYRVKHTGKFTAFDRTKIHYEYFLSNNSKGNLVIVHGFSEFTKKFYEFIYYALNQGYNVFIYDQRCHGLSGRLTCERDLLHVDRFDDYVKDLTYFIDEIVLKTEDKPLYLFAHSMGGAVASIYLAKHKSKIQRAVLSAPMFKPIVKDVPPSIASVGVGIGSIIFGKKRKFFLSDEFDPNIKFNYVYGQSKARFEHNMQLRRENDNYQSTPMSFGWVANSLKLSRKILNSRVVSKIETPILIISAKEDDVVRNDLQYKFCNKCKTCSIQSVEHATHAILASNQDILFRTMALTFDFLAS